MLHAVWLLCHWVIWRASETLSGVTQFEIRDISSFIYMCGRMYVSLYFDPRIFVYASWSTPPRTRTPPLNRIFRFSDPASFKEINCLPFRIRLFLNATRHT